MTHYTTKEKIDSVIHYSTKEEIARHPKLKINLFYYHIERPNEGKTSIIYHTNQTESTIVLNWHSVSYKPAESYLFVLVYQEEPRKK